MDIERNMEFIVENLAALTASQQAAETRQQKAGARLDRLERQMGGIQKLIKMGARTLVSLGTAQKRTEKALADLTVQVAELAAQQKRTDQRFDRWLDSFGKATNGHKKRSR